MSTTRKRYIAYFLLLIPVFIFYSLFCNFLTNIPYIDDFSWYFNFINKFSNAHLIQEKLTTFLEPYNNHRHYFQRSLLLVSVYITGKINISFFIILGNLFLLAFLYIIIQKNNLIGSAVLVWLAFQPISFMNYYTFAFFNLPVLLFALLCIRKMIQQADLKWVILFGILATFSNGNGLLVWFIGILISLIQANYKRLIIYGLTLSVLILFYSLQDSHAEPHHVIDAELIVHALLYFIQIHAYFLNWPPYTLPWLPIFIGTALLLVLGYFLLKNKPSFYTSEKSYLLIYLVFLSLSMALISLLRPSVNGLTANVIDHYKIYPCLFLGCLIYYSVDQFRPSVIWSSIFWVFSIFITLLNYTAYIPRMYSHFNQQTADALNYHSTKKWLFYPVIQGEKEYAFVNNVSAAVIAKGFYSGIAPRPVTKDSQCEARIDSTGSTLIVSANKLSYSPFTEKAFFVVNCNGLQYHFPALFDRSWKDVLKFRFRQDHATALIDWKAMHEPCLRPPDSVRFAVLKNGYLTYYPLSFGSNSVTK